MLFGVLFKRDLPLWLIFSASLIGLVGHFALHLGFGVENPSVSASYAIIASAVYALLGLVVGPKGQLSSQSKGSPLDSSTDDE